MNAADKQVDIGQCALTGETGKMAKSHIIPNAFMRRATSAPFMEVDGISRSKKQQTGWYDQGILGMRGEAIIASLDDAAAKCFVNRGYTYRKRRSSDDFTVLDDSFVADRVYEVEDVDCAKIRLFALSLLWRAAASSLKAMQLVQVRRSNLIDIGRRIVTGNPGSYRQYPVYFGLFCGAEELSKMAPFQPESHPFFRFFLDGVVAYVCPRRNLMAGKRYGRMLVGSEPDRFPIYCFPSAGSSHATLTNEVAQDVAVKEGDIFSKFRH